jgi:AcrR family transcriptional regulator
MARHGYESTSIAQIAAHANISKGLLYNYFESKEALLKSLVQRAFSEGDRIAAGMQGQSPGDTIKNVFEWFFTELRDNADQWKFISSLAIQMEKYAFVQAMMHDKMEEYVRFLERLLTEAGFDKAREEARVIAALMDGIGFQYIILKESYPLREMKSYLISKYCNH